ACGARCVGDRRCAEHRPESGLRRCRGRGGSVGSASPALPGAPRSPPASLLASFTTEELLMELFRRGAVNMRADGVVVLGRVGDREGQEDEGEEEDDEEEFDDASDSDY
ncbi:hypothetical protein NpPPO83_00007015, partial [Neofusicoccum parvum]